LGPPGTKARGHEFRYFDIDRPADADAYAVVDGRGESVDTWGLSRGRTLASCIHLHFGGTPEAAEHFVAMCRESGVRA